MYYHLSCTSLIIVICSILLIILPSVTSNEDEIKSLFTLKGGCALLGYPHAILNKCGYCVGPDTQLPSDFGIDCLGRCSTHKTSGYDCAGQCYGSSFRDECSNSCVNSTALQVVEDVQSRDCRGLCTSELSPEILLFQYKRDKCNMCRLASDTLNSESSFIDCTGKCVPPGGPRSTFACNKCINETTVDTCSLCPNATCTCDR